MVSTEETTPKGEESVPEPDSEQAERGDKLFKSPRFKGYLTIFLASLINFRAAVLSRTPINYTSVPASSTQQAYAKAVSILSAIVSGLIILAHWDRFSPLSSFFKQVFSAKTKIELRVILFLLSWWFVATIVQTSVRGIAGDGKEQYNLYYSTWVCLWSSIWTLEKKMVDYGFPTIKAFVTSWPYRAPGWIAIFVSCFFTLFWYVDLFINTAQNKDRISETLAPFYESIPKSQYQWLLFVAAFTLLPSAIFIFVEILRDTKEDVKGSLENILEGFCLFLLSLCWIPSVIVATTPGGFASLVGNAYFFTWGTTIFVLENFLNYIHDFRGSVHKALKLKEEEYKRHQQEVIQKSRKQAEKLNTPKRQSEPSEEEEEEVGDSHYHDDVFGKMAARPPPSPPRFPSDHEEDGDIDSVEREVRFKEQHTSEYFDNLEDILE